MILTCKIIVVGFDLIYGLCKILIGVQSFMNQKKRPTCKQTSTSRHIGAQATDKNIKRSKNSMELEVLPAKGHLQLSLSPRPPAGCLPHGLAVRRTYRGGQTPKGRDGLSTDFLDSFSL